MAVREWQVTRALESTIMLAETMPELTEEEVLHCLSLEAQSCRRKSILISLIKAAARFNKRQYIQSLMEKHHVPH